MADPGESLIPPSSPARTEDGTPKIVIATTSAPATKIEPTVEHHPELKETRSKSKDAFFLETDDDEEETLITAEFVHKHQEALRSQLDKIDREKSLKEVATRLTYSTPSSGGAHATKTVIAEVVSPTPTKEAVPGASSDRKTPETDMMVLLSSLLTVIQDQRSQGPAIGATPSVATKIPSPAPTAVIDNARHHTEGQGEDSLSLPYKPNDLTKVSKFTRRIAEASLPPKLKMPSYIGQYDGTQDPDDHIYAFWGAGQVGAWNEPTWCHVFA
jgi:hypothetical protein